MLAPSKFTHVACASYRHRTRRVDDYTTCIRSSKVAPRRDLRQPLLILADETLHLIRQKLNAAFVKKPREEII